MKKQLTIEEMGVVIQSAYDMKQSTDRPPIDHVLLKKELEKFNNIPEKGMYAIGFKMTSSGGSIGVLDIDSIGEKDGERRHGEFNTNFYVLVEHREYGNIEPYNRQSPFYVPKSYANMKYEFHEHGDYMVYRSKRNTCRLFTSLDEDMFNNFWGIYTHVVYVHNTIEVNEVIDKIIEIAIGKKE